MREFGTKITDFGDRILSKNEGTTADNKPGKLTKEQIKEQIEDHLKKSGTVHQPTGAGSFAETGAHIAPSEAGNHVH